MRKSTIPILASSLAADYLLVRHGYTTSYVWPFALLATLQFTAAFIYNIFLYPYFLSPTRRLPGPSDGNLFMGQFPRILRSPSGAPQIKWLRTIPNDGLIRYLGLWNRERIMITDPKMLQEALYSKSYIFQKPKLLSTGVGQILGPKGILFAEGDVHRQQRKSLLPAFHFSHIKKLVPVFWAKSLDLADKIAAVVQSDSATKNPEKGALINLTRWASLSTLDIIGEAGLGSDFKALETEGKGSELAVAYSSIFSQSRGANFLRFLGIFLPHRIVTLIPIKRAKEIEATTDTLKRVSLELVVRRRRELESPEFKKENDAENDRDILTVMLKSGEYDGPESQEVIRDQLLTFLAAGHETTATSLVWSIHLLTKHPEYQSRLREEVRAAFPGGPPAKVTWEQLDSLKFLKNIMEETTRVYPAVPLTMRETESDTMLGDQFIPKGTAIVIPVWAINKDPQAWGPDADEFKPERWDTPGGGAESNYNMMTFLAGPRSCIGKDFSKAEFRALLAALVGRFEFTSSDEKLEIAGGLTSRPKGGLNVWVKEIPGWSS